MRLQPAGDGLEWLIVGGEDHRSGSADDMDERFERLEKWTRKRYPNVGRLEHRWSGQVMEPADFLPYSGRDASDRIYLHRGDSGQGMTNGVAGALNFIALLRNDKARYGELFDPARKPKRPISLGEYVKGQGRVVANLPEYLGAGASWSNAARRAPMSAASSIGTASKNAGTAPATVRSSCPTER